MLSLPPEPLKLIVMHPMRYVFAECRTHQLMSFSTVIFSLAQVQNAKVLSIVVS